MEDDTKCTALGATIPSKISHTLFHGLDQVFRMNISEAIKQYNTTNRVFDNLKELLKSRLEHTVSKTWKNADSKEVPSKNFAVLRGRTPLILESVADPVKYRTQCFRKLGILINPVDDVDFKEVGALLAYLKLTSTYINQSFSNTSANFLSSLSNKEQIVLPLDDNTKFQGFVGKAITINIHGKYESCEKSSENKYICLIPNHVGQISTGSELRLKKLFNQLLYQLSATSDFMLSFIKMFRNEKDISIADDIPAMHMSFSRIPDFLDLIYDNSLLKSSSIMGVTDKTLIQLKHLASMLSNFNANNFRVKNTFKIEVSHNMFDATPGSQYVLNDTAYLSNVLGSSKAVLSLPFARKIKQFVIVPFVNDGSIFKYKYLWNTPVGSFVSNNPLSKCTDPFASNCMKFDEATCATAFLRGKILPPCMRSAVAYTSAKIISCKGSDGSALVVSTPKSLEVTLDCHGSNDFMFTLSPGTSWLKPCVLRHSKQVINSMLGAIPKDITSPYFDRNPTLLIEHTSIDLWFIVICAISIVTTILVSVCCTLCCVNRRYVLRRLQRDRGGPGLPEDAQQALPMVINYNLQAPAQNAPPPASGFIEPLEIA